MIGCDEECFRRNLVYANEPTCLAVQAEYKRLFNREILADVQKKFGSNLRMAITARFTPRYDFHAQRVLQACKGWGTDKPCLSAVLGTLSNYEVQLVSRRYNEIFRNEEAPYNDIRKTIGGEWMGAELRSAFLSLLDSKSPKVHWTPKSVYPGEAQYAAQQFRQVSQYCCYFDCVNSYIVFRCFLCAGSFCSVL
jgi:hypothetical protein